ncbi:beta-lactamase family protein [Streptomyces sp. NBC_01808]|uniref:serine hydrolase domain-containing protein n=1 Tax=Streptomyces sp. NBC_01808 TaxID=2975947 RepID=UPI002DD7C209|nr:serine hydrolase domain-containing protein [Streptomyces sp. NBC_01808]WSA41698.1 beta-lactamase family protein [Streptomyces sp. NBC_01808]
MTDGIRATGRRWALLAAAGALVAGGIAPAAALDAGQQNAGLPAGHDGTQAALDAIVAEGTPGALAAVRDGRQRWSGEAGVADLATGEPRRDRDRFRVGSLTKTFTATVLLQLDARGVLSLDDTVERWLPGVVRGNGNDGREITVRHLLNHTSGIFNYNRDEGFLAKFTGESFLVHRYDGATPQELVEIGLSHPPLFAPGTGWEYSDTNYILAGMVIERATGDTYASQVSRRILEPLKLRATSVPGSSAAVPRPHGRHYSKLYQEDPNAPVHDVTEFNPTVAWSAGQVISTTRDLNRFYAALLGGELLPREQVDQMLTTVPIESEESGASGASTAAYGLGIRSDRLSCGVTVWGHGGQVPGSLSRAAATRDGRHVLTVNRNGDWGAQERENAALEAEFCG